MVNWKKVKITSIKNHGKFMILGLDDGVVWGEWKNDTSISVMDCHPFNTWRIDDYIEVNLDKSVNCKWAVPIADTSIVRKVSSSVMVPSSSSGLTIPTTPSSAAEVARTVTQTVLDHADRTGGIPQIEIGTDKTSIRYYPPKK
jgi:hypothetical protein